jgi:PEP-CTERM motif
VGVTGNGFAGGVFSFSGGTSANNILGRRIGTAGYFFTESGAGTLANVSLYLFSAISGDPISAATVIPVAYDFTLTKQSGAIGNVNWMLHAEIPTDDSYVIGSGTLNTPTATFTGTGAYTVLGTIPGDSSKDFKVYLTLTYTTAFQQELAVFMNSGSQGFTLNAAAIPEPSAYAALFGLGALGLVIVRRSRRAGTS